MPRIGPPRPVVATRAAPLVPTSGATTTRPSPTTTPPAADPSTVAKLLDRVATTSRGPHALGQEAIVPPVVAERARAALVALGPLRGAPVLELFAGLTGPSAPVAQALLVRAVAARHDALSSDDGGRAVRELRGFARAIAPLSVEELRARTTSLDLDETRNTSTFDPQALWSRRGVVHDRGHDDVDPTNDGLFQRFTASCGPTTVQMMLAEADPIIAFALHDGALLDDADDDAIASFQRRHLEAKGGVALGRREAQLRARLNNALGRLCARGVISDDDRAALRGVAYDGHAPSAASRRALDAVRARFAGFPRDDELARLAGATLPKTDEGIGPDAFQALLDGHITPRTGVRYTQTTPADGFARGQAWRHLDDVARALRRGHDVPFGVVEPGHWMMMSAVTGRKPARRFLVSDPDGGRTAWVDERALVRGTFADDQFFLASAGERPYIDCFFLPDAR